MGSGFGREANVTEADTYLSGDGLLVMRSRELIPGKSWTTGALISNRGKYGGNATGAHWQYGRFCIRAKLPGAGPDKSRGLWPAHWMMPSDYTQHCGYVSRRGGKNQFLYNETINCIIPDARRMNWIFLK